MLKYIFIIAFTLMFFISTYSCLARKVSEYEYGEKTELYRFFLTMYEYFAVAATLGTTAICAVLFFIEAVSTIL